MNNSRLLMVAALTAMVGFYTLGVHRAGVSIGSLAVSGAKHMQAKQIARAGIGLGLTRLESLGIGAATVESLPISGGTLSYTIGVNPDSTSASIVSTGSYGGHVVQVSAWIDEVSPHKWVLKREYWQRVSQ